MSSTEAAAASPLLGQPLLTDEDNARSRDRSRVHHARAHDKRRRLLWLLVGPGILAMLGENDGPSMIAYASDGAQYGLGFFVPLIPILLAMAFVVQEMCMRVGAVTHRGYGELLSIALNANVLATVLLPVSLVFVLMLANDRELMGRWRNRASTNAVGALVVVFVGLCGAAYGIDSFLQTVGLIGGS